MQQNGKREKLSISAYEFADLQYRFATMYRDNDKAHNDYGTGDAYTQLEVHTVSQIEDNPGITVTEIAELNMRTKGAVSQIVTKLENKGLVRREKDPENPRRVCLYVTPLGLELSRRHKEFDDKYMGDLLERWISLFGRDAVEKYFLIMQDHLGLWNEAAKAKLEAEEQGKEEPVYPMTWGCGFPVYPPRKKD